MITVSLYAGAHLEDLLLYGHSLLVFRGIPHGPKGACSIL